MKQEIKDRWTTALRSGQYEQGKRKFEQDGKFCCLGVLCDVMGQPTTDRLKSGNWPFAWENLGTLAPRFLANMNDNKGMTFAEIADWIDENIAVTP